MALFFAIDRHHSNTIVLARISGCFQAFWPMVGLEQRSDHAFREGFICARFSKIGTLSAIVWFRVLETKITSLEIRKREGIMFRRTLMGTVAVLGLLAVGSGSAFANHGWGGGHYHGGGYGYGGYRGGPGYAYRPPVVVAPRPVIVAPPVYAAPGIGVGGCNTGYGPGYGAGYGYGSPYGSGISYSSPGFGFYYGR